MQLSTVNSTYGAPMGRMTKDITNAGPVKMHLQHVTLNSGGYDSGGAYWGLRLNGERLYWYWWNGNRPNAKGPIIIQGFIDAKSREDAQQQVLAKYPEATFYNSLNGHTPLTN